MRHLTASQRIAQLEHRIANLERKGKSSYIIEVGYSLRGIAKSKAQAFRLSDDVDQKVLQALNVSNPEVVRESVSGYDFKNTYKVTQVPNVPKSSSYLTYRYPTGEVDVHVKVR
jgi:hypothetical protein